MYIRAITKCGQLTLPKVIRVAKALDYGTMVDIEIEDERIIIKKHEPRHLEMEDNDE